MKVPIRIRRQPDRTSRPTYQTYEVECEAGNTVLDVLNKIQWEQDGTLVYRRNCRNAICGSCAMRVNGRAILACHNLIGDELEEGHGQITIQPLGNLPVIRDLVVDMGKFWAGLKRVDPTVSTTNLPERESLQTPAQRAKLQAAANCILCGACYSECNAVVGDENFVGPHALAKAQRLLADNRDDHTQERIQQYTQPNFAWDCTRCFNCNEVCPVGVQPLNRITEIKQTILQTPDLVESTPLRHRHTLVDLVKEGGWIDESKFGLQVVGNGGRSLPGLLSLVPLGLRMILKGKLPAPWHFKASQGTQEVRAIITAIQRKP
ncbi:succinate dehydrogenase/fumarate reductase iron-sulfur subunit [Candidatus Cyanaurora vandensis]|uniref:succinate dehydrogenase/fumarate reductase iron-sulfur subunit n=1 Tax=Candidatus Cyanaurora vandensis TaxID=2714958 RepID=UPI002580F992|nr:succinate dehydrogenase/fumarate reductase iron-sulfur subunit [Candidatus Cyanaurora vandensis]